MKLYIWEGNGISDAYHDDGTLVVLAESPERARVVVRASVAEAQLARDEFARLRDAYFAELGPDHSGWSETERGKAIWARHPGFRDDIFDGTHEALDREPDRIVDLDRACIVAFNGGGYD